MPVSLADIQAARSRIQPWVHRTPLLTSESFNDRFGCQAWFKAECFQKTGSFKIRGATNAVLQLSEDQKRRGILTFSSGNHAQALALAGRRAGAPVTVVMPHDAPPAKKAATEAYGAEVVLYHRGEESREALGRELAESRGLTLIPPYDHPWIIAGQGTCGLEVAEEAPDLDLLLVPCGGGGLLGGSAAAVKGLSPRTKVVGVEPEAGADGGASFRTGRIQTASDPQTIADGARTPYVGSLNFQLMQKHVADMTAVTDRALWESMWFLWTRMKVMAEPTGALGMAAIWEGRADVRGLKVGVILSGGNCDPSSLVDWGRSEGLLPDQVS